MARARAVPVHAARDLGMRAAAARIARERRFPARPALARGAVGRDARRRGSILAIGAVIALAGGVRFELDPARSATALTYRALVVPLRRAVRGKPLPRLRVPALRRRRRRVDRAARDGTGLRRSHWSNPEMDGRDEDLGHDRDRPRRDLPRARVPAHAQPRVAGRPAPRVELRAGTTARLQRQRLRPGGHGSRRCCSIGRRGSRAAHSGRRRARSRSRWISC